jgi:WD40 repeat protein
LGSSQKPSGVLIGHTEGITNVSAKGDGRYVISNGKDQALRLWDLRKMRTNEEYEAVANISYGIRNYDYRYIRPYFLSSIASQLIVITIVIQVWAVSETNSRCASAGL